MKKILSLMLTFMMVFCTVTYIAQSDINVSAENNNVGTKIMLNGEMKSLIAYNIKDNNYFKLRDIANLLKGTDAQFDVIWNADKGAIELLSNTPYSTNEALTDELIKNPVAKSSYVPIYKDGALVLMSAYNIADNNYFKLRDVASAIDFGVDWNGAEGVIEINTSKSYEYPTSSSFGLNTQYLSYLGKTKAEIDKLLGNGTYSWEWGMSTYSNNIMFGWNSLGGEPENYLPAVSMYIPLDKLFFDCPETVTKEQIKSLFNSSSEEYNDFNEENVLTVNYCGKALAFYPDYGLTNNSLAFINVTTHYENPNFESIQIINSAEVSPTPIPEESVSYYDYAKKRHSEFYKLNLDWRGDTHYYHLIDIDHDGEQELAVKIGCGVAIYKKVNGSVEEIFYDRLPESSGRVHYWIGRYDGKDYIVYSTASSSEYLTLYKLTNGKLEQVKNSYNINYQEFLINEKAVSKAEYDNFVNSIEYPVGITIEALRFID